MKLSLSIAIPLVFLGLVFLGGYLFMPAIDSPQTKLDKRVQETVELAQRMLNDYNAAAPRIEQAFRVSTQPADIDSAAWRQYTEVNDQHPLAATEAPQRLAAEKGQLSKLSKDIAGLGGEPGKPSLIGKEEAFRNVQQAVAANRKLLDGALAAVREALKMSEGAGDSEARGTAHPVATRLEAILLYHKADLMRREAALARVAANQDRLDFARMLAQSRQIDDEIKAANLVLTGGTAQGLVALPSVSIPVIRPVAVAPKPVAKPKWRPSSDKGWVVGNLVERLRGKPASAPAAEPEPAPAPDETVAAPQTQPAGEVAKATSQPETPAGPAERVPSLGDRIAALNAQRTQTTAGIDAANAEVERLTRQQQDLNARIEAATQQAKDAELAMIEAERTGVKGAEAKDAEAFQQEYSKLSDTYRGALQEVTTLKEGSIRNAKSAADEPEQILRAPLVAADPSKPMQPERGLDAVETDLATAKRLVATRKTLLTEIDRQIAETTAKKKTLENTIAKLQNQRGKLLEDAAKLSTAATIAVVRADQLEKQALELIDGPGEKAANQAKTAANTYQRKLQDFIRRENPTDMPVKKLTDMAADQYTSGGALCVKGDLDLLAARTHLQRASDVALHEQMLRSMTAAGMATKLDAKQLPEGVAADAVPAAATGADEAAKFIQAELAEAAKCAKQAMESYTEAAKQLKELWSVHASIAAVHLLMAQLPRVQGDTEDHLAQARQIYSRAIQGREELPEYATYRWIVDGLKNAQASAADKP